MAIYRGIGGAGDSTTDATVTAVTEQAVNAATSATNAATSATQAASSAASASSSETNAATSESNAATSAASSATSATAAASSATDAASSATDAQTAQTAAETAQTAAETAETNAGNSAIAADASANDAADSETNAAASATAAAGSATAASTSATSAATSATAASTSASNAATSATAAAASATSASASADAALSALDNFDDRYLGQKTSDPTVDNDGDALISGALYFNTTNDEMKVYDGSQWLAAYASLSGALIANNNLSDLTDAGAARTNLGLGTAATTASTDYATAAQGALADSALQSYTETDPVFTAWDKSTGISITESQISDFGSYETTFTKNTAFNKNFGTTTGTVAQGDDSRIVNGQTAYGWGNHASAGYLTDVADNSVGADELNVTGNGTSGQALTSDGDGSFSWSDVGGGVESGTVMLFVQSSAPTGWTKSTTHNDKALRIVNGTVGSGGSSAFSTAFGTPSVSGNVSISGSISNTTLSTSTMPAHAHKIYGVLANQVGGSMWVPVNPNGNSIAKTQTVGGSGAHGHSHTLSGSLSSATAAVNVQYVDVIIATKD